MHVVALTRGPRTHMDGYRSTGVEVDAPIESWLVPVASVLSILPYDLRLKLAGAPPWLVARVASADEASSLASELQLLGCGVVQADLGSLAPLLQASRVTLRDEGVFFEPERAIAYADLGLLVCATIDQERTFTREPAADARRFVGPGAAQHVHVLRPVHERTKQRALYLFERVRPEGVRLVEGMVSFQDIPGTTSRLRYDAFLQGLRERTTALVHDRMLSEPRRQTSYNVHLYDAARSVNQGNLRETDIAATLLALAMRTAERTLR